MKLEGGFEYKKALILTPERVREFETILLKYCKEVSYEATTVANTDISFETLDELLGYDNFQNRRIKSLTVTGRAGYDRIVSCIFEAGGFGLFLGYDETCVCRYAVSDVDTETTLHEDMQTFLKKATAGFWLLGKIRLFGMLAILCWLGVTYLLNGGSTENTGEKTLFSFIIASALGFSFVGLIIVIDYCVLRNLFPPLSFLWGEEIARGKKAEKMRSNLFWVVIIGILITVFGPQIAELIF